VLERVIKTRYETLSKKNSERNLALERLAHESIKEKKKKDKIVKYYNNLWRVSQGLKKKVRSFRKKERESKHQAHASPKTLAEVTVQYNEPVTVTNPTNLEQ
jgi:arginine deiminase